MKGYANVVVSLNGSETGLSGRPDAEIIHGYGNPGAAINDILCIYQRNGINIDTLLLDSRTNGDKSLSTVDVDKLILKVKGKYSVKLQKYNCEPRDDITFI